MSFRDMYFQCDAGSANDDGYEITLQAASQAFAGDPSITLVTRASPRNYAFPSSGPVRSYIGAHYDEIN